MDDRAPGPGSLVLGRENCDRPEKSLRVVQYALCQPFAGAPVADLLQEITGDVAEKDLRVSGR